MVHVECLLVDIDKWGLIIVIIGDCLGLTMVDNANFLVNFIELQSWCFTDNYLNYNYNYSESRMTYYIAIVSKKSFSSNRAETFFLHVLAP